MSEEPRKGGHRGEGLKHTIVITQMMGMQKAMPFSLAERMGTVFREWGV